MNNNNGHEIWIRRTRVSIDMALRIYLLPTYACRVEEIDSVSTASDLTAKRCIMMTKLIGVVDRCMLSVCCVQLYVYGIGRLPCTVCTV